MSSRSDEVAEVFGRVGTVRGTAREMGLSPKAVRMHMQRKGLLKPMVAPVVDTPDSQIVKRTSTLVDAHGNIKQQWVIAETEKQNILDSMERAIVALTEPIRATPIAPPVARLSSDYHAQLLIGDPHFGMLACADETGSNWDLQIAEAVTTAAARALVERTPECEELAVIMVGDITHTDGTKPLTPGSGNLLDADSRFWKVFWSCLRTAKAIGEFGLRKHKTVSFYLIPGNHDPTVSRMLSIALHQFYEHEPRVHVDVSPRDRRYYRFGSSLVGLVHGHQNKADDLPGLMAVEMKKDWAECDFYYWKCGHIHHKVQYDNGVVTIEYLRSLASSDAWHIGKGYISIKDATMAVLHRRFGECERKRVTRLEIESDLLPRKGAAA